MKNKNSIWKNHNEEKLTYEKIVDAMELARIQNDERIKLYGGYMHITFCEKIQIWVRQYDGKKRFTVTLQDEIEKLEVLDQSTEDLSQEIEWVYEGLWCEIINEQCNKIFEKKQEETEKKIKHFNRVLKLPSIFE